MSTGPESRIPALTGRDSKNERHQSEGSEGNFTPTDDLLSLVQAGIPHAGDAPAWQALGEALVAVLAEAGLTTRDVRQVIAHAAMAAHGTTREFTRRSARYDIDIAAERLAGYFWGQRLADACPDDLERLRMDTFGNKTTSRSRCVGYFAQRAAIEAAMAAGSEVDE